MSAERYTIRVTKDYLVFCAGHFITYEGDQCERLHGHNYRAAVEVVGVPEVVTTITRTDCREARDQTPQLALAAVRTGRVRRRVAGEQRRRSLAACAAPVLVDGHE